MSEYEFTSEQNQGFDRLAGTLERFAIIFGIFGVVFIVVALIDMGAAALGIEGGSAYHVGAVVRVVAGAACIVIAFLFLKPVKNFRAITTARGQDISELLAGLTALNKSHNYLRVVLAIIFVGSLVGMIVLVV